MTQATHTSISFRLLAVAGLLSAGVGTLAAQTPRDSLREDTLQGITVVERQTTRRNYGAINATSMLRSELFKAACCNLGESFVNNPSVDVNYSDAATGAKQIKLLGLAGTYVQMLTENLPDFRGAALPYGLGYIPGSWMNSIQVSKGNSSVKNGYEAMTGQINVEYMKPEDETGGTINVYGNTMDRFEADAEGNIHIGGNKNLSTEILGHFENNWSHHDGNGDGFQDTPNIRQYNFMNRWYWKTGHYMFHGGASIINENRQFGQSTHHRTSPNPSEGGEQGVTYAMANTPTSLLKFSPPSEGAGEVLWRGSIDTKRYSAYMKHAYLFGDKNNTNIALMGNVSMHEQDADYGLKHYDVNEKSAYASLMFETTPGEHNISAGLSFNYDYLHETSPSPSEGGELVNASAIESSAKSQLKISPPLEGKGEVSKSGESTPGAYLQYTYNHNGKFIAMAGIRIDHSNVYGTFVTPRAHIKWVVNNILTLRASAGKGYRSPHALAENNNLLASGRQLVVDDLKQERAWNYGLAANTYIPLFGKTLKLNAEYYYTRFSQQTVIDYDSDPTIIHITNLHGKSYSHTFQVDANYPLFHGFDLNAAYRYNLVKTTYGGKLMWKPLQSRYKALLSMSYKPDPGLWQFDLTFALNGGGRIPTSSETSPSPSEGGEQIVTSAFENSATSQLKISPPSEGSGEVSGKTFFKAYPTLNLQVKRSFRHFDLYVGGENLTNYKQKNPILGYENPWSSSFEPTLVYGPVTGAMGYVSIRINLGNRL